MALRTILEYPDPRLRTRAQPVTQFDAELQQLVDDMFETMYEAPGIGLAAPQINVSKRIFTVDLKDDEPEHGPLVLINPRFSELEGEVEATEGCLSVPGMVGEMTRFEKLVCHGFDRHGKKIEFAAEGWFARCLQHEMDHLDGILYVDKARNVRPAVTEEEKTAAEGGEPGVSAEAAV